MATKPTHTTMQNTAAIPAARHTDPAGGAAGSAAPSAAAANSAVRSHLTAVGSIIMTGGRR